MSASEPQQRLKREYRCRACHSGGTLQALSRGLYLTVLSYTIISWVWSTHHTLLTVLRNQPEKTVTNTVLSANEVPRGFHTLILNSPHHLSSHSNIRVKMLCQLALLWSFPFSLMNHIFKNVPLAFYVSSLSWLPTILKICQATNQRSFPGFLVSILVSFFCWS